MSGKGDEVYKLIIDFFITIDIFTIFFSLFRMTAMGFARFVSMFMLKKTWTFVREKIKKKPIIIVPKEQVFVSSQDKIIMITEDKENLEIFLNPLEYCEKIKAIEHIVFKACQESGMEFINKEEAIKDACKECNRHLDLYSPDKGSPSMFFIPIALEALKEYEISEIQKS